VNDKVHKLFFISAIGFAIGIALRSFVSSDNFTLTLLFILLGGVLFLYYFFISNKLLQVLMVAIFVFSAGIGMLRFDIADISTSSEKINSHMGNKVVLGGVVIDEKDERETNTKITVRIESIFGEEIDVRNSVLVTTEQYPLWEYGDKVSVSGRLDIPKNFRSDTGREFDYVGFLAKDNIYYQMFYPDLSLLEKDKGNIVKRNLFSLKQSFLESISVLIPEPHASLLGGLVVGAKQSLGKDLLDKFRITGVIHIVVLSGYNVTIVAEAIMRFFSFIPKRGRFILGAGSILAFMMMVGAGATVVRASIMALLVVFARATGRTHEITIALIVAGLVMLVVNPYILIFDPSFQLSFMATLGLLYLAPLIEKYFNFVPTKWQLREFATATIATQIFVLPLLIYMMGEVSLVAVFVNLLVLIFIPATMLLGFLAGIIGFVSALLALPFAYLAYGLLAYELAIVDLFAGIPFASVAIPQIPFWSVVVIYILYIFILLTMKKRFKKEND